MLLQQTNLTKRKNLIFANNRGKRNNSEKSSVINHVEKMIDIKPPKKWGWGVKGGTHFFIRTV